MGYSSRNRFVLFLCSLGCFVALAVLSSSVAFAQDVDHSQHPHPQNAEELAHQPAIDPADVVERTSEEIDAMGLSLQTHFMSPYCPGMNLRDCTSGAAVALRDLLKMWAAEGRSISWMEERMVEQFGESILGSPRFKGFNTLVWIAPFFGILVGLALILSYLQKQNKMKLAKNMAGTAHSKDYVPDASIQARVEAEVSARLE